MDANNAIVQLCALGMQREGEGKPQEAEALFQQAWNSASSGFEKCISAHYMARHQSNVANKLHWDEIALQCATEAGEESVTEFYPSLYLNLAKDYEDLDDLEKAGVYYELALSSTSSLPADSYHDMIKKGIINGWERVKKR